MTDYYVDNAATGSNNGTSWANAWESFADINWVTMSTNPPNTVYISGGSVSKTYNERLYPSGETAGGNNGDYVTIDVGANSPAPSGHDGIVIIDKENAAGEGILLESQASYIRISGLDSDGNYKFEIRNIAPDTGGLVANKCVRQYNGDFVEIDGLKCPDIRQFAMDFQSCENVTVKNCYIESITGAYDYWVECTYTQNTTGFTFENNTCIMNISPDYVGAGV